jgi:salicylate hydroxylase
MLGVARSGNWLITVLRAPIVIVGAGIGGLALGLALKAHGIDAIILERRPSLPHEGAGLQIGPNGTACLHVLGVYEAVRAMASAPEAIVVHDGVSGRIMTQMPLGMWVERRHGSPYWVTRRVDLARVLYSAARAAGVDVRFGVDVVDVSQTVVSVRALLAGGTHVDGAALIGADGVSSRIRARLFGRGAAVPSGRVAARLTVPRSDVRDIRADAVSVWLAPRSHLVAYPVQRGEALNIVLISSGDAASRWSGPVAREDIQARFKACAPTLRSLAAIDGDWRQWPITTLPPLHDYARGRIALIGDAAHPMPPFLAQGAVMAMEDALVLTRHLKATPNQLEDALAAYARARLQRTHRVVATAEQQGQIYHMAGALRLARNATLRLLPPALLMRRYDWLYGGGPVGNADIHG